MKRLLTTLLLSSGLTCICLAASPARAEAGGPFEVCQKVEVRPPATIAPVDSLLASEGLEGGESMMVCGPPPPPPK
jgi:hypothetical protein